MFMGARLKALRTMLGMTQEELAQQIGVNRSAIQKYESGRVENVPVKTLEALANALDVAPHELMGWHDSSFSRRCEIALTGVRQVFGMNAEELLISFYRLSPDGQALLLRIANDMHRVYGTDEPPKSDRD